MLALSRQVKILRAALILEHSVDSFCEVKEICVVSKMKVTEFWPRLAKTLITLVSITQKGCGKTFGTAFVLDYIFISANVGALVFIP